MLEKFREYDIVLQRGWDVVKILFLKLYFFLLYLCRKKGKRYIPEKTDRIVLIMCKWIGDTFWDMQGIPALQKKFPDAEIHVVIKPFSKFLFRGILPESQIHTGSCVISDCRRERFSYVQWKKELSQIRNLQADLLIDFTETPFSAVFSALSGAKYLIGYDHPGRFSQLYDQVVHVAYELHLSKRPLQLYFPLLNSELEFPQVVPRISEAVKPGFDVIIFPGAGWSAKEYPVEKFHIIARSLSDMGYSVCAAGSIKEKTLCEKIISGLNNAKIQIGSQEEMLRHLATAKVCLSGDTGPAHLAAANGIFTITLFCGTNPLYCGPIGKNVVCLSSSCPDVPKGKIQFCPADRRYSCSRSCFMDIEPEKITGLIDSYFSGKEFSE